MNYLSGVAGDVASGDLGAVVGDGIGAVDAAQQVSGEISQLGLTGGDLQARTLQLISNVPIIGGVLAEIGKHAPDLNFGDFSAQTLGKQPETALPWVQQIVKVRDWPRHVPGIRKQLAEHWGTKPGVMSAGDWVDHLLFPSDVFGVTAVTPRDYPDPDVARANAQLAIHLRLAGHPVPEFQPVPGPDGVAEWFAMQPGGVALISAPDSTVPPEDRASLADRVQYIVQFAATHPEWLPTDPIVRAAWLANRSVAQARAQQGAVASGLSAAQAALARAAPPPTSQHVASFGPTKEDLASAASAMAGMYDFLRRTGVSGTPTIAIAANPAAGTAVQWVTAAAAGNAAAAKGILTVVGAARNPAADAAIKTIADLLSAADKLQTQARYVQKWFGPAEAQRVLRGWHMSVAHAIGKG